MQPPEDNYDNEQSRQALTRILSALEHRRKRQGMADLPAIMASEHAPLPLSLLGAAPVRMPPMQTPTVQPAAATSSVPLHMSTKQPSVERASDGEVRRFFGQRPPDDPLGAISWRQNTSGASPRAPEEELLHQAWTTLRSAPKIQGPMESNMPDASPPTPTHTQRDIWNFKPSELLQTTNGARAPVQQLSNGDNVFQSSKISFEDSCFKVLPIALKNYKITDDWRLYTLFIRYGNTERCLSLDEKPLLLFQKLKDAGKNPELMIRPIRDIRAPIAIFQGKEAGKKTRDGQGSINVSQSPQGNQHMNLSDEGDRPRTTQDPNGDYGTSTNGTGTAHGDAIILWTGISYAIAIYPYGADYDDEFDVTIGAMLIVLRKSKGWWQVQRDPSGYGIVDDRANEAWVPSGCLLETIVPPSTAIILAANTANTQSFSLYFLVSPLAPSDAPILPGSIVNTSYPGVTLMDRVAEGDHELDLVKDDTLRVFKRHHHWSYVVKENGCRGWTPSWLIGKVLGFGRANPVTPATRGADRDEDGDGDQTAPTTMGTQL